MEKKRRNTENTLILIEILKYMYIRITSDCAFRDRESTKNNQNEKKQQHYTGGHMNCAERAEQIMSVREREKHTQKNEYSKT